MAAKESKQDMFDNTEALDIEQRTTTIVVVEVLLRPEQIKEFKHELEELRKKFMRMT